MPFIKRKIQPIQVRCHRDDSDGVFEEHEDVVNNAMVGALLQLSSVTFLAEDVFREIEEEFRHIHERCLHVEEKLEDLQGRADNLNPKEIPIPMSDLSTEGKIPLHLHYKSSEGGDEELFRTDSRSPCLIHLHQIAKNGFEYKHYDTPLSPIQSLQSSFVDEDSFLQNTPSTGRALSCRSTSGAATPSSVLDGVFRSQSSLPTPAEKIKQECSQHKTEIVTVDTSGIQFQRRVVLRRSQRSSVSSVRRRSQLKYRSRINTVSAVSPQDGLRYDLRTVNGIARPTSALSDDNSTSSFFPDSSVCNSEPSVSKHNAHIQTDVVRALPASKSRKNAKHRYSMPIPNRNTNVPPNRAAHVSLHTKNKDVEDKTTKPPTLPGPSNNQRSENNARPTRNLAPPDVRVQNHDQILPNERLNSTEDRISSGFWSGTESCRHSTTSEILMQHHNVTQALQQILGKHPPPTFKKILIDSDDSSNVSTLSLNSHLSTFRQSPNSSSMLSLDFSTPVEDRCVSPDAVFMSTSKSQFTPRNFSTPPGGYNYMNPGYEEHTPHISHLPSPMDLIHLNQQPHSSRSTQNYVKTFNVSESSINRKPSDNNPPSILQKLPFVSQTSKSRSQSNSSSSAHTPRQVELSQTEKHFFGPAFNVPSTTIPDEISSVAVQTSNPLGFQSELKSRIQAHSFKQKTVFKPPPPRRTSSLKRPPNASKAATPVQTVSVSSNPAAKVASRPPIPNTESHYQTPRSPPARKIDDFATSSFQQSNFSSSNNVGTSPNLTRQTQVSHNAETPRTSRSTPFEGSSTLSSMSTQSSEKSLENLSTKTETACHNSSTVTYAKSIVSSRPCTKPTTSLLGEQNTSGSNPNAAKTVANHNSCSFTPLSESQTSRRLSAPESNIANVSCKLTEKPPPPKRHSSLSKSTTKPTRFINSNSSISEILPSSNRELGIDLQKSTQIRKPSSSSDVVSSLMTSSQNDGEQFYSLATKSSIECGSSSALVQPYSVTSLISDVPNVAIDDEIVSYPNALPKLLSQGPPSVTSSKTRTVSIATSVNSSVSLGISSSITSSGSSNMVTTFVTSSAYPTVVASPVTSSVPDDKKSSTSSLTSSESSRMVNSPVTSTVSPIVVASSVSTMDNTSSKLMTTSVTASPMPSTHKPVVRPKPFFVSSPRSEKTKKDNIKRRTANARAAFFGLSTFSVNDQSISAQENIAVDAKTDSLNDSKISKPKTDTKIFDQIKSETTSSKPVKASSNQSEVEETDIDDIIELDPTYTETPASSQTITLNQHSTNEANCSNSTEVMTNSTMNMQKSDIEIEASDASDKLKQNSPCNRTDFHNSVTNSCQIDSLLKTDNSKSSIDKKATNSINNHEPLRSSRETNLVSNSPTNKQPVTRHSNSPSSTSSVARDNFKAMLLQNFSRSSSGSQMTATEKLQRAGRNFSRFSTSGVEDHKTAQQQRIVSVGDLRAVLGASKPSRRLNHATDHRKYPSALMNGRRYSAKSRLSSRPMHSISEDVETDDILSVRTDKQRSVSVTDL